MAAIELRASPGPEALAADLRFAAQAGMRGGFRVVVEQAAKRARDAAPRRKGKLRHGISSSVTGRLRGVLVSRAPYSSFLHEGTGLYGPRKRHIVIQPRKRSALWWPGARHPVDIVFIRGIRPRNFLRRPFGRKVLEAAFDRGFREALRAPGRRPPVGN
jgi:hypothetical protein